jgi:Ca-activated chloride channel family protein
MSLVPLVPWWLLALVVVPLLGLTVWQAVAGGAHSAGPMAWWRRTAAVLVLALIGLGPSIPSPEGENLVRSVDVFFVVDRTGSMAAEDYDGDRPRLDGVRHDIVALAEAIPDARYSVISFDSQASRQLPLTSDPLAITSWAETFDREVTIYSQGSLTDRPLEALRDALEGAQEQNPQNLRVVFFLSDGEQTAEGEPKSFAELAPMIDAGAVLGYGTPEGGPMKINDPYAEDPGYIKDYTSGDNALSKIDKATLTALADQLGVPYVPRDAPSEVTEIVAGIDGDLTEAPGGRDGSSWRIVVWPLALVLAGLLVWEAWSWSTTTGRSRGGRR